jgi:NADH dehydrogenase FAD-containing subunit
LTLLLQYTPLLPAVAVGTVEEASICEPVRLLVKDKVRKRSPTNNAVFYF